MTAEYDLLLAAEGLSVQRGGRTILDEISLELRAAELVAVVGPNGAGKTTLLRTLSGLLPLSRGRVSLEGRDLADWKRREVAQRVAYLPQSSRPQFAFSVEQVVAMGRYPVLGPVSRRDREDRAIESACDRCRVGSLRHRSVLELSGGELQRVLLARALATESRCLLLDEPTASLDLQHELEVFRLIRELADDGCSIMAAIHDLNAAVRFADRVVVLSHGRLAADGPPQLLTGELVADVFGVQQRTLAYGEGELRVFE